MLRQPDVADTHKGVGEGWQGRANIGGACPPASLPKCKPRPSLERGPPPYSAFTEDCVMLSALPTISKREALEKVMACGGRMERIEGGVQQARF